MSMTESEAKKVLDNIWDFAMPEDDDKGDVLEMAVSEAINALEEIQQYRAIGTVSEFRELKEKATAKKPILYPFPKCPVCKCILKNEFVNYCDVCGQKIL